MSKPWKFESAHGPVSTRKGDAILKALKGKSGDIDILQKHLAVEQAINADDPLVLNNKLVLLQDGQQPTRPCLRPCVPSGNISTWKPTFSRTMRSAGSSRMSWRDMFDTAQIAQGHCHYSDFAFWRYNTANERKHVSDTTQQGEET